MAARSSIRKSSSNTSTRSRPSVNCCRPAAMAASGPISRTGKRWPTASSTRACWCAWSARSARPSSKARPGSRASSTKSRWAWPRSRRAWARARIALAATTPWPTWPWAARWAGSVSASRKSTGAPSIPRWRACSTNCPSGHRSRTPCRSERTMTGTDSKAQQRLQMADIARLAGVSTSTVSRALSGSSLVNEETRARILELARSLKYSINIGAQNLRLKQNRTVGVVVPFDTQTRQHLSDPFFLSMLGSLADALTEQGFDMLVTRVDAEQLDQLAARRVPIVVWGAQLPQQLYTTIGGDNVAGGHMATAHLLAGGRRRIAFFGDTKLPEVAQRYRGYCQALAEHGLAIDAQLCVSVSFLPQGGDEAVRELTARGVPFDAVLACSDLLA